MTTSPTKPHGPSRSNATWPNLQVKHRLNALYARHCGRTLEEVERTLDRDHFMTAEEAKAWGIIDHVYASRDGEEAA